MKTRSRRRWLWGFLLLLGTPLLLVVILLQPPVLKAILLPRLENSLEMTIEVDTLHLSLLKRLKLGDVHLRRPDGSMEMELEHAVVYYDVWSLFGDNPVINSLSLKNGELVLRPDQATNKEPAQPEKASSAGLPPKLRGLVTGPLTMENITLRMEEPGRQVELSGMDLELASFDFTGTHTLELASQVRFAETAPLEPGAAEARLSGTLHYQWPLTAEAHVELHPESAAGTYSALSTLGSAVLEMKLEEEVMEHLKLHLQDSQGQTLGRVEGRSPLNPLASNQDVTLHIDQIGHETFLLLGGMLGMDFGRASLTGTITGNWEHETFSLSGSLRAENLGIQQQETVWLKPNDYSVDLSATFDRTETELNVKQLELGWKPEGSFTNQLNLNGNLHLRDPHALSGNLVLKAGQTDLDAILPASLLERSPPAESPTSPAAQAAPSPLPIGNLTVEAQVARLRFQEVEVNHLNLNAQADSERIRLEPLALELNDSLIQMTADLPLSGKWADLQASLQAENLHLPELLALSPVDLPVDLLGRASVQGRIHLNEEKKDLEWTADIRTSGFSVQPHDGTPLLLPNDYHLSLKAGYTLDTPNLKIGEITLGWKPEEGFENELKGKGSVGLADPKAITGVLSLNGKRINLDAVLPPPPPAPAEPQEQTDEPHSPPSPLPLGDTFTLNSQFQQIQIRGQDLAEIEATAISNGETLKVVLQKGRLNGSEVTFRLDLPSTLQLPDSHLEVSVQQLDVGELVDGFAPAIKDRFDGMLDLSGSFTLKEPYRESTGNLEATITKGRLFLLEEVPEDPKAVKMGQKLTRLILESTARVLNVPPEHFTAPPIEEFTLRLRLQDSVLELNEAQVANEEILLRSQGRIPLQAQPSLTPLEDIQIQMGVSTNIAARARIYRENRVQDDRVMLPAFLQLEGTLGEPELDVKKRVITGLILSGVTDHIQVGGEDTHSILQGVGALLTGERLQPTPTPKPGEETDSTEKPGRGDRILEGIDLFLRSRE